jgi:hypothetical protein
MVATERELAVALAIAREHGVRVDAPVVVRDVTNLLVHLAPSPVVARVARTFSAVRGIEWMRTQVELSQFLVDAGAPVAAPSDELPPGPHVRDGLVVTFWRWYDHDAARDVDLSALGRSLRELHDALAGIAARCRSTSQATSSTCCSIGSRARARTSGRSDARSPMRAPTGFPDSRCMETPTSGTCS